jgi:hypothetical protein
VISRTNTPDSGSNSNPKSTCRFPTAMKSNRLCSAVRLPPSPRRLMNIDRPSTKVAATDPTPSQCPHLSARRPSSSRTAALTSGMATSSQMPLSSPVAWAYSTVSST